MYLKVQRVPKGLIGTDRQTDTHTHRQTDIQTDRQTEPGETRGCYSNRVVVMDKG